MEEFTLDEGKTIIYIFAFSVKFFVEHAWVEEQTVIYILAFSKEFVLELTSREERIVIYNLVSNKDFFVEVALLLLVVVKVTCP